jgi:hypothetical protein
MITLNRVQIIKKLISQLKNTNTENENLKQHLKKAYILMESEDESNNHVP